MKVEISHISKTLRGAKVLDDVSLTLEGGNIYGLMGENGSGKTMLMRTVCGLVRPDRGTVTFDGQDRKTAKPVLGVMIENTALYPDLTGMENLGLFASILRIADKNAQAEAMERVGLDPKDRRTYRKYSLGMKQRLLLAQAIMEKPQVLLLDEPTNAIDAEGVALTHEIMRQEADRGAVVLLASHISADIHDLCCKVYRMDRGRLEDGV
ncbi:MAG: ABC transporter ATP-binding protein [Candidatus Faecousia sp.]|nr:ABC transporter ATP-binding protein [Clostridiales bacterium]MDD6297087.1 ABC transporter ATP-binding protein [Bacillota bacterium]MDD7341617.1 ABC transporter ATP-binding protein [Bacillota bacterium]MDY2810505.1 ABC transporter ATP-binding protein [Candidatus Faecousia sp.]